jgi:putative membrane protein
MSSFEQKVERRGLKDYLGVVVRGFLMGAADVVPGVSGGTMAFITGIYEELIQSIHAVDLTFIRRVLTLRIREAFADFPWRFLLALALGIVTAIISLAPAIDWTLENYPSLIWAFFFGLVLASAVVVRKRVQRWRVPVILALVIGVVFGYSLIGMVPVETPDAPWFLFLSGAIAINAMILPGISGAFVMVLLGKYQYVLQAVINRDIVSILILLAGAAVGLVSFVRVLRWLFRNFHDVTVAALIGLILGALRKVWPWKEYYEVRGVAMEDNVLPAAFNGEVLGAIFLMVAGFFTVLLIDYIAGRSARERGEASVHKEPSQLI